MSRGSVDFGSEIDREVSFRSRGGSIGPLTTLVVRLVRYVWTDTHVSTLSTVLRVTLTLFPVQRVILTFL